MEKYFLYLGKNGMFLVEEGIENAKSIYSVNWLHGNIIYLMCKVYILLKWHR